MRVSRAADLECARPRVQDTSPRTTAGAAPAIDLRATRLPTRARRASPAPDRTETHRTSRRSLSVRSGRAARLEPVTCVAPCFRRGRTDSAVLIGMVRRRSTRARAIPDVVDGRRSPGLGVDGRMDDRTDWLIGAGSRASDLEKMSGIEMRKFRGGKRWGIGGRCEAKKHNTAR
ncbi:hypothetical protein K3495_g7010 [Podosphaera aphanis]|nr:hypothetical protein K3495_g7010 [Podosphaera aphanis]